MLFGKNFENFINENLTFEQVDNKRDIYFNIEKKEFWIHSYSGNESLSPDTVEENILIFSIPNNFDWVFWNCCGSCENCGTDECPYEECMAESFNECVHDSDYIDVFIRPQIIERINPDVAEFEELIKTLAREFGVNKYFNSFDITDSIVDEIVENGFSDADNDNVYLSSDMDHLVAVYVDGPTDAGKKVDERLFKMAELLNNYDVNGALELFK